MPTTGTEGPGLRYIVRAAKDNSALTSFLDSISSDPAVRVVDTIGPTTGLPHTVVIETDALTAEGLIARTRNQLMIEPDRPLSLF